MGSFKIAVTGGTGFVGRHLLSRAVADAVQVTAFVRRSPQPPLPREVRVLDIGPLMPDTNWTGLLSGVDVVIYLASRVHVMRETAADPLSAYRHDNVDTPLAMARAAADQGVRRFIYVSSIKANGEETPASGPPFSTSSRPAPVDPYGISKLEAEETLGSFGRAHGLEVIAVRPPLVYGTGVKGNFARLIRLVQAGIPLPFASIANRRSMIGVDNLSDLLLHLAKLPVVPNRHYLASDGQDLSTPELIRMIARALDRSPRLVPMPVSMLHGIGALVGLGAEIQRLTGSLQIDASALREELGWIPPVTVPEGIQRAVLGNR